MENGSIGFNVAQANTLMNNMAEAYNKLEVYLPEAWESLLYVIQGNWIGEDEQDFERNLATRLCELNLQSGELVKSAINTVAGLAQSWHEFQQKNTLSGAVASGDSTFNLDIPSITIKNPVVEPNIKTIANNANRGLQSSASASQIKQKITDFVNGVKKRTGDLFDAIEVNSAFFGEQVSYIKSYITNVGDSVSKITTSVQDMFNALDQLVGSQYTGAVGLIGEHLNEANSIVQSSSDNQAGWIG